jgi:acetyl esterase/lipase
MFCSHRNWAILSLVVFIALLSQVSAAAEPVEMLLWPDGAPGALGEEAKDKPKLIAYVPEADQATGAAIVVCPGGGYGGLAMDHEGHQIAQWLNSLGVAAFIADYRHRGKGYGHPAPLQDAQRAIRTVRARAKEWNVKPNRIGILGFSAGGHLASTAATHFDDGNAEATDAIEKVGCRPDFAVLCYAVIAFGEPYTHGGSQKNLIGENAAPDLVKLLSNEKQVTEKTPPTFLWHTSEDTGVLPDNSTQFYLACIRHKVPAELHIYEKGRHGVGLGKGIAGTEEWPKACQTWMKSRGLLQ